MDRRDLEGDLIKYCCQLDSELSLPDRAHCFLLQATQTRVCPLLPWLSWLSSPMCCWPLSHCSWVAALVCLGLSLCIYASPSCLSGSGTQTRRQICPLCFVCFKIFYHSFSAYYVCYTEFICPIYFLILFKTLAILYVFFFNLFTIYLAAWGLSCGMWSLPSALQQANSPLQHTDLVPWPGVEPGLPALGVQSLKHWDTGEVLFVQFRFQMFILTLLVWS